MLGLERFLPLCFYAGCGEMPSGLEQAVKLMVPGELASVACRASHAYGGLQRDMSLPPPPPASSGIGQDDAVLFEVELVSFDREGHWQVRGCGRGSDSERDGH